MIKNFTYNLVLKHGQASSSSGGRNFGNSGGKSNSRYKGGFIMKNGRKNNSSAYNHDYYIRNKEKWREKDNSSSKDEDLIRKMQEEYRSWDDEKKSYVDNDPKVVAASRNHVWAFDRWKQLGNNSNPSDEDWKRINNAAAESKRTNYELNRERMRAGAEYDKNNSSSRTAKKLISKGSANAKKPSGWPKEYYENLTYNSKKNRY